MLSEAHYSTEVLYRLSLLSYNLDCDANLGLSNYKLPDSAITASSVRDAKVSTSEIRLNQNGWCAATKTGKNSWVQVDLLTVRFILTKPCTGLKVKRLAIYVNHIYLPTCTAPSACGKI